MKNNQMMTAVSGAKTVIATAAGTLVAFFANVETGDMVTTAIHSCVGAVASFLFSTAMKVLLDRVFPRKSDNSEK